MHSLVSFVINSFLLGVGLAMDAFSVSMANGLNAPKMSRSMRIMIPLTFAVFQFLMPVIGFFLGKSFENVIKSYDHWIAFGLLTIIGINMLKESFDEEKSETLGKSAAMALSWKKLVVQAIATSIDAMAVGISFAVIGNGANIFVSSVIIGIIAFAFSYCGGIFGKKVGCLFQKSAERIGGIILIGIGVKILIEHLVK